jgi:hypothetical protein
LYRKRLPLVDPICVRPQFASSDPPQRFAPPTQVGPPERKAIARNFNICISDAAPHRPLMPTVAEASGSRGGLVSYATAGAICRRARGRATTPMSRPRISRSLVVVRSAVSIVFFLFLRSTTHRQFRNGTADEAPASRFRLEADVFPLAHLDQDRDSQATTAHTAS